MIILAVRTKTQNEIEPSTCQDQNILLFNIKNSMIANSMTTTTADILLPHAAVCEENTQSTRTVPIVQKGRARCPHTSVAPVTQSTQIQNKIDVNRSRTPATSSSEHKRSAPTQGRMSSRPGGGARPSRAVPNAPGTPFEPCNEGSDRAFGPKQALPATTRRGAPQARCMRRSHPTTFRSDVSP